MARYTLEEMEEELNEKMPLLSDFIDLWVINWYELEEAMEEEE